MLILACMRHVRYYTHDYKRIGSIITGEFIMYVSLTGECNDSDIHKIFVLNDTDKLMAIAENGYHFNLFGDILNKRSLCENMSKSNVHIIMTINRCNGMYYSTKHVVSDDSFGRYDKLFIHHDEHGEHSYHTRCVTLGMDSESLMNTEDM